MKRGVKTLACLFGCAAVSLAARVVASNDASADNNPYGPIVERNVFDLKPPPPPANTNDVPATPPPNVKLTGITTMFGNKRAFFMVQDSALPGKPAGKPESVILSEGQRQGGLEVLEINPKAETVKVDNDGEVSVISIEKAKLAGAAVPGAGGGPGIPGGSRMPFPQPNFPVGKGGSPGVPVRPIRTAASPYATQPSPSSPFGNQSPFNNNYGGQSQNATPQPQQPQLTPEEQIIAMEVERERTKDDVAAGFLPPLPPTVLTEAAQSQSPTTPSPEANQPAQSSQPNLNPALGPKVTGNINLSPMMPP